MKNSGLIRGTMRVVFILALVVLGSASDSKIDKARLDEVIKSGRISSRFLDDLLLEVIEQIQELMRNGSDVIPVLDPLRIESIRIDEGLIGIPGAFISLQNLTVVNLSNFVIDTLQIDIQGLIFQRYFITFDAYIPEINLDTSSYDLFLRILGGEIYGNGDMKLKVAEPRIKGVIEASLTIGNGIFLNLVDCNIGVSLGSFEPEITGFWNSETSSAFVSAFLRNLIPELLEFFEKDINDFINMMVLTVGNEILKDLNLIDIINP